MKPKFYFITTFHLHFFLLLCELVEFTLGSGYQYDIYYSLQTVLQVIQNALIGSYHFQLTYDGKRLELIVARVLFICFRDNISAWDNITNLPNDALQLGNSETEWKWWCIC